MLRFMWMLLLIAATQSAFAQNIIYVNWSASGNNTGDSWDHAYNELRPAIVAAQNSSGADVICIAQGTYTPGIYVTDTWNIPSDTTIIGGYNYGDNWQTPNAPVNSTVLTGEINTPLTWDNVQSIFLIEDKQNVVIKRVVITHAYRTTPALGLPIQGGGMTITGDSHVILDNVIFTRNTSETTGGSALYIDMDGWEPTVHLNHCLFVDNLTVSASGGALYCQIFSLNPNPSAVIGLALERCAFVHNAIRFPPNLGGGVLCTQYMGAAAYIYMQNTATQINNCLFAKNESPVLPVHTGSDQCVSASGALGAVGGAIMATNYTSHGDQFNVSNCTFYGNQADNAADIFLMAHMSTTIKNCIFWSQRVPISVKYPSIGIFSTWFGRPDVQNCCFQEAYPGLGNITDDPMFVNPLANNFALRAGSRCIDAGTTTLAKDVLDLDGNGNYTELPPFDFNGNLRVVDGDVNGSAIIDIGAYEKN